jgi:hypothetical protein
VFFFKELRVFGTEKTEKKKETHTQMSDAAGGAAAAAAAPQAGTQTLYQVLGVERDATPDQIKQAHRRLALQWHPDRRPNDPSAKAMFQAIQHAYEVLSDPSKRAAYDLGGERGVAAMDNQFTDAFGGSINGPMMILLLLALSTVVFLSLLLTLAGVAAKLDGANSYSWTHSLFGVWFADVFVGIICLVHAFAFFQSVKDRNLVGALIMFVTASVTGLFLIWTVFVGMNLDGKLGATSQQWPWLEANSPGIAAGGLVLVTACVILYHAITPEADAFEMNLFTKLVVLLTRLLLAAAPAAQLILISLKADGKLGDAVSWFVVLLPAFLISPLRGISACVNSFLMMVRGVPGWRGVFCKELCGWIVAHVLYLTGIGLIAEKLQFPAVVTGLAANATMGNVSSTTTTPDGATTTAAPAVSSETGTTRSWGVTFVPFFIVAGGGTLLLCCMVCHFTTMMSMMAAEMAAEQADREQQQQQQQQPQRSSPYSNATNVSPAAAATTAGAASSSAAAERGPTLSGVDSDVAGASSSNNAGAPLRRNDSSSAQRHSDADDANSDTPIIVGYGSTSGGAD